jgi:hypothetical protein
MATPRVSKILSDVYVVAAGRDALSSNVYLIRSDAPWTLVDAGWSGSGARIVAAAEAVFGPGVPPASMVLTHVHSTIPGLPASWRRGGQAVRLREVPRAERQPVLRAYLLRWGRQPNSRAVQHELGCPSGSAAIHRRRSWLRSPSSTPCSRSPRSVHANGDHKTRWALHTIRELR